MLSSRFLVEEDAEAMQQELREAFRLYDKEGKNLIIFSESSKFRFSFTCI
jgi:Ca2+-binding EF-hand superfamily protein